MDKYTVSKIQRNYLHPHQEWLKLEIDFDLDDGVTINYEKFETAVAKI